MDISNRKLAAIVFSDVVDFTVTMAKNEKLGLKYIKDHSSLIADNIKKYNGEVLKELGDGCLMIFDSAYNAVKFSKLLQEIITGQCDFKVRVGIHVGDVIKEKDDLRTKINQEEHLLDLLSGDNQIEHKSSLKVLILLKDRLNKTNDKFESIKNWYDENKIPPPGSSEDNKKIKLQKLYVEKVRERIVSEIASNSQNIKPSEPNKEDWSGSRFELSQRMRMRKDSGEFEKYRDAYRYAEANMTHNGKPIKWKLLEKAWEEKKDPTYVAMIQILESRMIFESCTISKTLTVPSPFKSEDSSEQSVKILFPRI